MPLSYSNNLKNLFQPNSIALVGASRDRQSVGYQLAINLQKFFPKPFYFVNPHAASLLGQKVYQDIDELPSAIDLAIIAIPAAAVLEAVEKLIKKKIGALIVISAGFQEIGEQRRQQRLRRLCQEHGIALLGPNCLGLINPHWQLNASFDSLMPQPGKIAFLSQSGALLSAILDQADSRRLRFSKIVSLGNKALIDEAALLPFFYQDKKTEIIACYSEQLKGAQDLIAWGQKLSQVAKPMIILKAGRSQQGARAAASHTGSLSGDDRAYRALFQQAKFIQAESMAELIDLLQLFQAYSSRSAQNVAILTNAGGPGILATDALEGNFLKLAPITTATKTELQKILPSASSLSNPIDILGDADEKRYRQALAILARDKNIDAIAVIVTPQAMTPSTKIAAIIHQAAIKTPKLILSLFLGRQSVQEARDFLRKNNLPAFANLQGAMRALGKFNWYYQRSQERLGRRFYFPNQNKKIAERIFTQVRSRRRRHLTEVEAREVLSTYEIPLWPAQLATSQEEARQIGRAINRPLALKIVSADILHKSDIGGVRLNVQPSEVASAYRQLQQKIKESKPAAAIDGVLISPMIEEKQKIELIVGSSWQKNLGHLILLGLGGVYVEVFADVRAAFSPLREKEVARMIAELKIYPILAGARGRKPYHLASLRQTVGKISQLVEDFPMIKELDINPFLLTPTKGFVLDARIILRNE